ncbi:DUF1553 domain-containing protein [Roseimaritima ulvae]|uniref:Planctomycete cytochrome C n=1 Tax=Roseimaritima ulvae TaxID=980254 RepID=A0A5B9QPA1_9BACT|nr:DUF1553 domain-containing protein [Roseimaritima ulvae]QEG38846.1 Planctomycete cytochrome C [Roseimaritima ulvae]
MRIHRLYLFLPWLLAAVAVADQPVDFNRDIRPILSNKCLLCHGPDESGLEAGLRLDQRDIATSELDSGLVAIQPGKPDESELMVRIATDDEGLRMPPEEHGKPLSEQEVALLRRWIAEGAPFAKHWSYVAARRPEVPEAAKPFSTWPINPVDAFVLRRMRAQGLQPSPPAERAALARRVFLDLTGLPPTVEEVDAFVADEDPQAYEHLVDDLLRRPAFGEHWARKWLDLARYADSAGYADDPARTIWAYRDWVIAAINDNVPFDQFTRDQLAGDLLPEPSEQQLVATAFHRNTLTNSEGGTIDEEFRNEAIVDRVNTTMAVWMGTTMACAQCHTHKYDPLTQEEYFRLFAIFNNTQDADRKDEAPTLPLFTEAQKRQRQQLEAQIADLQQTLQTPTPELQSEQQAWETALQQEASWQTLTPAVVSRRSEQDLAVQQDGIVFTDSVAEQDVYTLEFPLDGKGETPTSINALRLEALPQPESSRKSSGVGGGNFVLTGVRAQLIPRDDPVVKGRYVRVTNHGKGQILSLAEVQVFDGATNVALDGKATQHSTDYAGPPEYAIDGNTDGVYTNKSVTHTAIVDEPWWEVDLGSLQTIERVVIWNRTDNGVGSRLANFSIEVLDEDRQVLWQQTVPDSPAPSMEFSPNNVREVRFVAAFADYYQDHFEAEDVLRGGTGGQDGWAINASPQPHQLVLIPERSLTAERPAMLRVVMEQLSPHKNHLLGRFRWSATDSEVGIERAKVPQPMLAILDQPVAERSADEAAQLAAYFRQHAAPALVAQRQHLAEARERLAALRPATSVPVMREREKGRRETFLQHRGSYLAKGPKVQPGVPAVFPSVPEDQPINRLALATWITRDDNPLTARVLANRYWETLFGRGIVLTSEEFGSQGELPTHPELLDWLATELLAGGWDRKAFLRMLVTSATYRQSAKVESATVDPGNVWLARGPRVRLSAEMVRDQALFVAGLLSPKMYGPPVKPPQPSSGLSAAFGATTDWKTSVGEDRYRRGIYTMWRRSSPYPSMATFDAPNREVCTVRRNSTNTPLQSLVTLNDPVYVEASQSLARIALQADDDLSKQLTHAFHRCVLRPPSEQELAALVALYRDAHAELVDAPEEAVRLASDPLGPLPAGMNAVDAAAMTVVGNVLLNLDEMFLKR